MKKPFWDFSDISTIAYFAYFKPLMVSIGLWSYYTSLSSYINGVAYYLANTVAQTLQTYFASTIFCKYVAWASITFALKFIMLVSLLVFVRGGIPRYRYDFLTKVGWIQMLNFILLVLFLLMLHYLSL